MAGAPVGFAVAIVLQLALGDRPPSGWGLTSGCFGLATNLVFPFDDGNGMFLSLGNSDAHAEVGLLFIDFERPEPPVASWMAHGRRTRAGETKAGQISQVQAGEMPWRGTSRQASMRRCLEPGHCTQPRPVC